MNATFAFAPALMLLACGQAQNPPEKPASVPVPEGGADRPDRRVPNSMPPVLTPEAERGEKGARNILLSFAHALERNDHKQAWAMLSAADKRKWSPAAFAGLFADLSEVTVDISAGSMEGAAGSSYYDAPIIIAGSDRAGRPVRIEGRAVLRRVNDVDGASSAQLRWHFETLTLDWTH